MSYTIKRIRFTTDSACYSWEIWLGINLDASLDNITDWKRTREKAAIYGTKAHTTNNDIFHWIHNPRHTKLF
jgi:hypothetical protein